MPRNAYRPTYHPLTHSPKHTRSYTKSQTHSHTLTQQTHTHPNTLTHKHTNIHTQCVCVCVCECSHSLFIPTLFSKYSATDHLFADDVQAYVHGLPSSQLLLASKIELLSNDLNSWMSSNRLTLNSAKTQLIWFGTPQQLLKLDHALLSDRFPHFTFHTTVRDLGVTLDSALTFSQHISNLT